MSDQDHWNPRGCLQRAVTGLVLLLLGIGLGWMGHALRPVKTMTPEVEEKATTIWTCSMHPQIQLPKPGQCPICFMDLIPLEHETDGGPQVELSMSEAARQLARIETVPVERRHVEHEVRLVGKVTYDERRVRYITAWVPGRLERLFVDYTGVPVQAGDHLVSIYSPEVYAAQASLLQAVKADQDLAAGASELLRASTRRTVEAARERLAQWGLTRAQIAALEARGQPEYVITIHAPIGGIVVHKNAMEGMYVQTGTRIYTIADLSRVWVKMDAYESDLAWLRYGQEVVFTSEAYPGQEFHGRIELIDPVLDDRTRTTKVRVTVPNPRGLLKPDMFVRARVRASVSARGDVLDPDLAGKWICPMHPEVIEETPGECRVCQMPLVQPETLGYTTAPEVEEPPLVVPSSAVLLTGTRAVSYVQLEDTEQPTYEWREVQLGPRVGRYHVIRDGLQEGEMVVARGAFKIDAERQIRAWPSMMSPATGTDGETGETVAPGPDLEQLEEVPAAFQQALGGLFTAYLGLHAALAADDPAAARKAAHAVHTAVEALEASRLSTSARDRLAAEQTPLAASLESLAGTDDLQTQREHFERVTGILERLLRLFGYQGPQEAVRVHCPMAFDWRGAYWLQAGEEVTNPYFGSAMLRCGTVEEHLPRASR